MVAVQVVLVVTQRVFQAQHVPQVGVGVRPGLLLDHLPRLLASPRPRPLGLPEVLSLLIM
jgi:hypothetical protein